MCGKYGHLVVYYWHRYDESLELAQSRTQENSQDVQSIFDHKNQAISSTQATTFLAHEDDFHVPANLKSQVWFADSSASHHITSHNSYFHHKQFYVGSNEVLVGDRQGLNIKSICSTKSKSNTIPNFVLTLNNLLHVPSITSNLIFVCKFSSNNNVFFEFHSNRCFVKSRASKVEFLEGFLDTVDYIAFIIHTWSPHFN